jgi:hypothetical protein
MGVLEKIPREGSISAKELASSIDKNEEVLGTFSLPTHALKSSS